MLIEIRFHGRGGQGAVTAANLLVASALIEGKYGQAFPFFGAERRGAPVLAFARISDKPIRIHSEIKEPDVVVVFDPSLIDIVNVLEGLKPNGKVVVNSSEPIKLSGPYEVYYVDATRIALKYGLVLAGWPLINTAMLGALVGVLRIINIESVVKAIKSTWSGKLAELNANAAVEAYNSLKRIARV